jgi:hypothetical protein
MKEPPAEGGARGAAPGDAARSEALTRHDGHPFERDAGDACTLCGESEAHILHHPTRIRAACALRGIDPAPVLARAKR